MPPMALPNAGSGAPKNPGGATPSSSGSGGSSGSSMTGSGGSTGSAGQAGAAGSAMPPAATGALHFTVLTKTLNGRYSPKNIGAIWIERASGEFVKTLEVWAATRARYLSRWRSEAGSNKVDAVTSATLRTHVTHKASWNLTDVSRAAVASGDYKVVVEITDHDGSGDSTEVPFTLGEPVSTMPSDQAHFVDMALTVE
jgi:hypothetical protein